MVQDGPSSPTAPDPVPALSSSVPPSAPVQQAMSDPSSRRALLLQALLARQQPTGRGAAGSPLGGSVGSIGSPASPGSAGSPTVPLPDVPLAPALSHVIPARQSHTARGDSIPLGLSLGEGALSEALMTGNWDQVVQGLDAAAEEGQHQHDQSKTWSEGGVSSEQLDQAQRALEAWANTHKPSPQSSNPYQSQSHHQSPVHPPPQPNHYGASSSPALSSSAQSPAPFPWAALYPHTAHQATPLGPYHSLPLPNTSSTHQPLNTVPYYNTSNPPTRSQSFSGELPSVTPPNGAATTTTTKKGKGSGKKAGKKAVASGAAAAAGEAAERAAEEESVRAAQANMTPEEIEEDKRRRNT